MPGFKSASKVTDSGGKVMGKLRKGKGSGHAKASAIKIFCSLAASTGICDGLKLPMQPRAPGARAQMKLQDGAKGNNASTGTHGNTGV